MLQQLLSLFLSPLAGVLVIVVVLIVGFLVGVKGHTTMTVPHVAAGVISTPVAAVGALGTVIALAMDPTITAAAIVTVLVAGTASVMAILTKLADTKIKLAEIAKSVDGVASRKDDEVSKLKEIIIDLHAQLAKAESVASTLAATHAAVAVATAAVPTIVPKVEP